jgi:hypothetical protein
VLVKISLECGVGAGGVFVANKQTREKIDSDLSILDQKCMRATLECF